MFRMLTAALIFVVVGTTSRGQDSAEVQKLNDRIEQLEKDLKSAKSLNDSLERQVERLEKQVEQLEAKLPESEKEGVKKAKLADLFVADTVLKGEMKDLGDKETGKMTITITESDGKKFKGTSKTVWDNPNRGGEMNHDIEGEIKQSSVVIERVGTAKKFKIFNLTLKRNALEGKWSNANQQSGTIGFTFGTK